MQDPVPVLHHDPRLARQLFEDRDDHSLEAVVAADLADLVTDLHSLPSHILFKSGSESKSILIRQIFLNYIESKTIFDFLRKLII